MVASLHVLAEPSLQPPLHFLLLPCVGSDRLRPGTSCVLADALHTELLLQLTQTPEHSSWVIDHGCLLLRVLSHLRFTCARLCSRALLSSCLYKKNMYLCYFLSVHAFLLFSSEICYFRCLQKLIIL